MAYQLILQEKLLASLVALFLAVLTSILVGSKSLWFRGVLFNFSPLLAAAFYIVVFVSGSNFDVVDIVSGAAFEFLVLLIIFRLLVDVRRNICFVSEGDSVFVLSWLLVFQLLLLIPVITSDGFGIFSADSRLDYIYNWKYAKYFTYAGFLVMAVQAVFIAALVSARGYLGYLGWCLILVNFAFSALSGSKGSVFLWVLSIVSLIDYRRANIPRSSIVFFSFVMIGFLAVSSVLISSVLNLDIFEFTDLVANRFFLTNDARALALDLRTPASSVYSFIPESFPAFSSLFGYFPKNDPLGILLYERKFNISGNIGANSSFMALATYYSIKGYVFFPVLWGGCGVIVLHIIILFLGSIFRSKGRLIIGAIGLVLLRNYSQDFFAFQIFLILIFVLIFLSALVRVCLVILNEKTRRFA